MAHMRRWNNHWARLPGRDLGLPPRESQDAIKQGSIACDAELGDFPQSG
jgi:hypothetical protein